MGGTTVTNLPTVFSDHAAILIQIKEGTDVVGRGRRPKQFRYEEMWQRHDDYVDFVNQSWDPGDGAGTLYSLCTSLSRSQTSLSVWDMEVFGSVRQHLRVLREELDKERSHTLYRGPTARERELMWELAETLAREEVMERQRSRADWLKSGDRNTGFFQAKAKARGRAN